MTPYNGSRTSSTPNKVRAFGGMKQLLLFALMAFTLSLGVSCKKENDVVKQEIKVEKPVTKAAIDPIFDYNPNVYPHSTGICTCNNCRPNGHAKDCKSGTLDQNGLMFPCKCKL